MKTNVATTVSGALAATVSMQAMATMAGLTVPVFATVAAEDLGLDPNNVGLYASIIFIGAMTSSLLCGGFVLRYGAIRISQLCLMLAAVGIAMSAGGTLTVLVLSAIVLGIGVGPATPASSHILARHTPAHLRSLVFSIKQTAVPIGGVLAGSIVPILVVYFGWRGAAFGVGVICLVLIVLVQPARRLFDVDLRPRERLFHGNIISPLILVLKDQALRGPVLASAAYSGLQQAFSVFLVTFLVQGLDMDLVRAGFVLAVAQGGRRRWKDSLGRGCRYGRQFAARAWWARAGEHMFRRCRGVFRFHLVLWRHSLGFSRVRGDRNWLEWSLSGGNCTGGSL